MLKELMLTLSLVPSVALPVDSAVTLYKFIHNSSTSLEIHDFEDLYNIFTFNRTTDDNGASLTVIHMPKDSFEFRILVKDILQLSIHNYMDKIRSKKSTGGGLRIIMGDNADHVMDLVSKTPVSIGYVEDVIYINEGDDNVKVIDVCNFTDC